MSATNPELGANGASGRIHYNYDANGNLSLRTFGNVYTGYTYDGSMSLTQKNLHQ